MTKITVLLAEDHPHIRGGVRRILQDERDIEIIGAVKTGRQAVQLARRLQPAVVVVNIGVPLPVVWAAARQILQANLSTRIIILSTQAERAYIPQANTLDRVAYLSTKDAHRALCEVVRQVASLSPTGSEEDGPGLSVSLTRREIQVLQSIAHGKANKQTADELGISIKTVEKHRQRLMNKLNIHSTAGLTRYAIFTTRPE